MLKKIKNKWSNTLSYAILILCSICSSKISAQGITGNSSISPGINSTYNWSEFAGSNPVWSSDDPTNVTITPGSAGATAVVSISKNIIACQITLTVKYDYYTSSGTIIQLSDTKTINIDPFLNGPTVIYPGESISITNHDNCAGWAGHNLCVVDWNCNDASALSCGSGGCSNTSIFIVSLNCPASLPTSIINSGLYSVTCYETCGLGSFQYPTSLMNVTVALHNPTIIGQMGIGCGGAPTTNLIYTASSVPGANYYVWTVPSFWSITSGNGTNAITVSSNGANGGNITVRAYSANGSPVKSGLVTFPVTCCITNLSKSTNVNSGAPDNDQAANTLVATNTINNGGIAKYHCGIQLNLEPGFGSILGSEFHAYIEGCSGIYNRMSNTINNSNQYNSNANNSLEKNSQEVEFLNNDNGKIENNINVYPNPNSGEFNLVLNNSNELPYSIVITDDLGNEVEKIIKPTEYKFNLNLKELKNGLYIINVFYSDKTLSKRIIKS